MPLDGPSLVIIVTTLGASVSTLFVGIMQYLREGRSHRWQVEQSERNSAERQQVAADLTDKIDENTELSKAAFTEANNVNMKIAAIGEVRTGAAGLNQGRRRDDH